ncbi:hypothetical protein L915_13054 [Phytophthora nicotianae]|uniref:Reverse transcriptase domain-containing protein n=1 Tax=Phytophthora nicotianae TaxID=4792 RepID=W2GGR6_PHYNI|nr:hypothetical protein L915_13054 [Phytophthora nicotianae]
MKTRCKLLVKNLFPVVLRVDIERLVAVTHQQAKHDDVALYELVVTRAKSQQHYHTMRSELKRGDASKAKPAVQNKPSRGTSNGSAAGHEGQEVERFKAVRVVPAGEDRRVCVNGVLDVPFCRDTGADSNIISEALVKELQELGAVKLETLDLAVPVQVAGGSRVLCRAAVEFDLRIETAAGPLHLAIVSGLVMDGHEDEFLLGCQTMQDVGIDIDRLFEQLASGGQVHDASDDDFTRTSPQLAFTVDMEEIKGCLEKMVAAAAAAGFDSALLSELRGIVFEFGDGWRVHIGADPPADVEPLQEKLRDGVQPYRIGTMKYPPQQRAFLHDFVLELERNGLTHEQMDSATGWSHSEFAFGDSECWCLRIWVVRPLEMLLAATAAPRELFRFVTGNGVFTPTRVPQGASDSAMYFQLQMQQCFREMLYHNLLVWIDDLLLFAKYAREYHTNLRIFFETVRARRLRFNAKKCVLFETKHSPDRLQALTDVQLPPTPAAPQHFLCAANWLRDSMVDFARVDAPLHSKLEAVMSRRGRRKTQLAGVDLDWTPEVVAAYRAVVSL